MTNTKKRSTYKRKNVRKVSKRKSRSRRKSRRKSRRRSKRKSKRKKVIGGVKRSASDDLQGHHSIPLFSNSTQLPNIFSVNKLNDISETLAYQKQKWNKRYDFNDKFAKIAPYVVKYMVKYDPSFVLPENNNELMKYLVRINKELKRKILRSAKDEYNEYIHNIYIVPNDSYIMYMSENGDKVWGKVEGSIMYDDEPLKYRVNNIELDSSKILNYGFPYK